MSISLLIPLLHTQRGISKTESLYNIVSEYIIELLFSDHPNAKWLLMNDFPVIGDLVMRTGLWDRQGANIGNRYKDMYGVELFLRLRPVSLDRECRILP